MLAKVPSMSSLDGSSEMLDLLISSR
jgi:hypothetical protein